MSYAVEQPTPEAIGALKGPAVLEFGTDWCGVCMRAERHILAGLQERVQHIKVENTGIAPWIDRMLTSEELGHLKPARACFDAALAATGTRAEEAWMIGDDHEADVVGAHEAGWRAVYFDPSEGTIPGSPAIARVAALRELLAVLP